MYPAFLDRFSGFKRRAAVIALAVLGLGALAVFALSGGDDTGFVYRTAKVERGTVHRLVSASGKLNAVITVTVSSQISGRIKEVLVDFNTPVKAGQVIARIDPESFTAKVMEARAELSVARAAKLNKEAALARAMAEFENAKAGLATAEADVTKALAALVDIERDFKRKKSLVKEGFTAESAVDRARAVYETGVAELASARARVNAQKSTIGSRAAQIQVAEAEVAQAAAQVEKQEASLRLAEVNLDFTLIRSPVDGIVIDRAADVGQTVAASLQAPVLFTIAQDLRQMQVEMSIDEADIGQVAVGQQASFEVDAFPGQKFSGSVLQIRKLAKETENVVTYTVVIQADNPDMTLLPGMTAQTQIEIARLDGVVKVPNAALRYRPPGAELDAPEQDASESERADQAETEAKDRIARLAKTLTLTQAQIEQISALDAELRRRRDALGGNNMERAARRKASAELRAKYELDLAAVLDEKQRAAYRAMNAKRSQRRAFARGRLWVLRDGKPKEIAVRIQASDGSFTAIAGGEINVGDEVIVGARAATSGTGGSSPLSRLRF